MQEPVIDTELEESLAEALAIPAEEPAEETRPANRKERRDYIKTLPRNVRLGYGFGRIHHTVPGIFVAPARPRAD